MTRVTAAILALLSVLLGTPVVAWSAGAQSLRATHAAPTEPSRCCCDGSDESPSGESTCACCRADAKGPDTDQSTDPTDAAPCDKPDCPCGTLPRGPTPTGPQVTAAIIASTTRPASRWRVPSRVHGDTQPWHGRASEQLDAGVRWAARPAVVRVPGCPPRAVLCIWTT